jgi:xyloglucan-specific endo-beta-1,4-glucanase
MKSFSYLASAFLATTALASPTPTLQERATQMCGSWGTVATNGFTVYHNNWGAGGPGISGSQCTTFNSVKSNSFSWSTSWSWQGAPIQVKSYSNVALEKVNKKLSAIKSIPSTWTWRYVGQAELIGMATKIE